MRKEFNLQITTETILYGYIDEPLDKDNAKGVVFICHGMAETIERYLDFMSYLSNNGYIVVGYNQRGHGKTAGNVNNLGYMDDYDNFNVLVEDLHFVNQFIKNTYPGKLIYLFGHSMGSFISERYIELYNDDIDGLILSGSALNTGIKYSIGHTLASIITKIKGRKHKSNFINSLSLGSYNKKFKPAKTSVDWLSRDNDNNVKYENDEYCGNIHSVSFFKDLTNGFKNINKDFGLVNSNLPIFIISGANDPVGEFGKSTTKLYKKYKNIGIKDLTLKLYTDARHELLNEINKEEVYTDILEWINAH